MIRVRLSTTIFVSVMDSNSPVRGDGLSWVVYMYVLSLRTKTVTYRIYIPDKALSASTIRGVSRLFQAVYLNGSSCFSILLDQ